MAARTEHYFTLRDTVGFLRESFVVGNWTELTFTSLIVRRQAVAGVALAASCSTVVAAPVHAAPVPVGAGVPHCGSKQKRQAQFRANPSSSWHYAYGRREHQAVSYA